MSSHGKLATLMTISSSVQSSGRAYGLTVRMRTNDVALDVLVEHGKTISFFVVTGLSLSREGW
jgi:hypothetical protein